MNSRQEAALIEQIWKIALEIAVSWISVSTINKIDKFYKLSWANNNGNTDVIHGVIGIRWVNFSMQ